MAKEYLTIDGKLMSVDGKLVQVPDPENINDLADSNVSYATLMSDAVDTVEDLLINGVIDGSPKGVYANLSALQTALPDGASGVYLTIDDGHWYFWNGSAWTDGGVYQANVLNLNSITIDKLKIDISNNFKSINMFDNSTIISGGHYSSTGDIYANANSQYSTQFIRVKNGVTYKSNISPYVTIQIVTYDVNGSFIERINQRDSNIYTFNQNVAFIRLSIYNEPFPNQFMFCEIDDFTDTFIPYDLKVIVPNADISIVDTIDTIGNKTTQNTITLSNLPSYSIIDNNCYADAIGDKVSNTLYTSVSIYAHQDFNIWYSGGTPTYLSLTKFNNGVWSSSNFVARYRNVDNNLPTNDNKLTINKGELLVITYNNIYDTDFLFDVDELINNFTFKNEFLLNDNQISQIGFNKVIVTKTNDNYDIYMGKYHFPFYKEIDLTTNLNSYDIANVYYNSTVIESGNILGVVRETNQDDFMGGVAHGDEQIISMNIYCDGKLITESISGNRVDIYLISNLQRVSDKTNVVLRNVHIIFENNTMTLETNFKFLVDNIEVEAAYVGMWGQYTSNITKLFTNIDEYNLTDPTRQINSKVYSVSYVSPNGLIDISIKKGYEYNKFKNLLIYYSDSLRVKNYFCLADYETFNTDDVLYGVTEYKFN